MYVPLEVVRLMILGTKKITGPTNVNMSTMATARSYASSTLPTSRSAASVSVNVPIDLIARRVITVMFMDLAGFTTICENLEPEKLIYVLTEYLNAMCRIIDASHGTLDKVIWFIIFLI